MRGRCRHRGLQADDAARLRAKIIAHAAFSPPNQQVEPGTLNVIGTIRRVSFTFTR